MKLRHVLEVSKPDPLASRGANTNERAWTDVAIEISPLDGFATRMVVTWGVGMRADMNGRRDR